MPRSMMLAALLAATPAMANEEAAYAEAEEVVRGFRAQTFLLTECETAFTAFWRAYRAEGALGLVHQTTPMGRRVYFGFGNPEAEPLLDRAFETCSYQIGGDASMVLRVLHDREQEKQRRIEHNRHAERIITGG